MSQSLRVAGTGMCCAVGFTAPAACAAIRAGVSRFVASEFHDDRQEPLTGARLPLGNVWGARRLAIMFEMALQQCVDSTPEFDPATTALTVLLPEKNRPRCADGWVDQCVAVSKKVLGEVFPSQTQTLALGRAGLGPALQNARTQLVSQQAQQVMLVGADSLFNAQTITYYLRQERLMATDVTEGFIPGEGVGILIVEQASSKPSKQQGLHILGIGTAQAKATIFNDEPMLADGMVQAINAAVKESGHPLDWCDFRMADTNGEPFYFKEAALAYTRALKVLKDSFPLLHIADTVGETGPAIGPMSLAYLAAAMAKGCVPGTRALTHFSNDDGARTALVVEHRIPSQSYGS